MDENIHKYCRICLDVDNEHVSILGDPTVHLHLKSCLAISVSNNDGLPKVICGSCVSQLNDFYNFQLNARCSQDWLDSALLEKAKKCSETKTPIQPLPDSEYNSDSLLEFLNNTANIEEYLNNLGKEDIPSIVNLLDRNENSINTKQTKTPSPKKLKKDSNNGPDINMEIDVLDSDIEIVKEIILKKTEPKVKTVSPSINLTIKPVLMKMLDKDELTCFACEIKFDSIHKLSQHLSVCDYASRTCIHCNLRFNSKQQMQQHSFTHNTLSPFTCNCGKQFQSKEKLSQHHKVCHVDYGAIMGCSYRCKECGKAFNERFHLYQHAKEHVLKAEERICDICSHRFIGDEALTKHKKETHDQLNNLLYRCKVCSFTSDDRKETYLHVQKHMQTLKVSPRKHLCESCGKSFSSSASLQRHSLQHEKLKEHICGLCSERFADEATRNEHAMEHSKVIMCERCGQTVDSFTVNVHKCKILNSLCFVK